MPIYEYRCNGCSHDFDLLVSVGFDSASCPVCGSSDCKRKMSAFGFQSGSRFTSATGKICAGCNKGNCQSCK